jgi:hypothetical protein
LPQLRCSILANCDSGTGFAGTPIGSERRHVLRRAAVCHCLGRAGTVPSKQIDPCGAVLHVHTPVGRRTAAREPIERGYKPTDAEAPGRRRRERRPVVRRGRRGGAALGLLQGGDLLCPHEITGVAGRLGKVCGARKGRADVRSLPFSPGSLSWG